LNWRIWDRHDGEKLKQKILKEHVERNISVLDDNIKMSIIETIFAFRHISSVQYGRAKFLEKFMKLLCIKTTNIFKNFAIWTF
jgi:hypothetical protein